MKNILFSTLFLLFGAVLSAQNDADNRLLKNLFDECYAAFAAKDLDRFMAAFSEDAQFIPPPGIILNGKEAIRVAHADYFKMNFKVLKTETIYSDIHFLNADTALCIWEDYQETEMGGQIEKGKTAGSCVAVRQNGKWLIRMLQITPVLPVPGQ